MGRRTVPQQEAKPLPSTPDPNLALPLDRAAPATARPLLALAICGAVLLFPLALSASGGDSGPGKDVQLAVGSTENGEAGEGSVDPGSGETSGTQETVEQTSSALRAPRRSVGRAAALSGRAPAGPGTTKVKAKVTAATTATTKGPPPATIAAAPPRAVTAAAPPAPPATPPPPSPAVAAKPGGDGVWDRLAQCESSNTNDADAPYYGFWQFSAETWHSVGEPGLPNEHSRERQLAAAKRLQAASGWSPWPACSSRLGLK